jgi:hypothetical protein
MLSQRLAQTIIDNEIAELSNRRVSEELQDAHAAVSQLTAHHARSVGLENRVQLLTQELEDMRQERDSETQKAKLAEARVADMTEKLSKLLQLFLLSILRYQGAQIICKPKFGGSESILHHSDRLSWIPLNLFCRPRENVCNCHNLMSVIACATEAVC